jgi:3-hydroxybutyryl-CoA dehydrogenase
MHILVIDGNHVETEFRQKFGEGHEYSFFSTHYREYEDWQSFLKTLEDGATKADVAFIFANVLDQHSFQDWLNNFNIPTFVEILWAPLAKGHWEAQNGAATRVYYGFCGLPTLLNRTLLEVSLYDEADREKLAAVCAALGTDYRVVADRVGLVTPRVVCMIINEACYTVQEGTATMQDVDLGMKLGTNYPRGPFAWANAIGVERVYAVLEAMWDDTHDERYKVCPLLKRQALRGQPFAV